MLKVESKTDLNFAKICLSINQVKTERTIFSMLSIPKC